MKTPRTLSTLCFVPVVLLVTMLSVERPHNPGVNSAHAIEGSVNVPPRIRDLLARACYDCHSSETHWPWYSAIPPVSHLIQRDVVRGRAAMNFSEWSTGAGHTPGAGAGMLMAACSEVEQRWMPKPPYSYLHPESRWTQDDVRFFCSWARQEALRARAPGGMRPITP